MPTEKNVKAPATKGGVKKPAAAKKVPGAAKKSKNDSSATVVNPLATSTAAQQLQQQAAQKNAGQAFGAPAEVGELKDAPKQDQALAKHYAAGKEDQEA